MRLALDPRPSTREQSIPTTLPAPTGGWNTRDGRANMPITDAIAMDNWFPEATDVRPRPGSDTYASGLAGQVETLFSYANGSNLKLLVAVNSQIQNISTVGTNGTVTSATVAQGYTNSRWQYKQFGTPGGNFLIAVNGADTRQIYDGSVWFSGSVAVTSPTISALSNIEIYQRRVFYLEEGTLRFIYHTNTDAIGGSIAVFNLASELDLGGELVGIGTWTRDGGSGMDDLISFISDQGQVAVYSGTDPGSASTWSRLGIFKIPPPLSNRATQKLGGELVIATEAGAVAMSAVLSGLEQQTPYTDKVHSAISEAARTYRNRFGWQLLNVPHLSWLVMNVPVAEGDFQQQYVMNTETMAWCRFKGWDANCFVVHNKKLYFGTNGSVIEAATVSDSDDGDDINVDVRQAASAFGVPGRLKHFKMFRPLINADGQVSLAADINVDFADTIPTNIPAVTPIVVAEWDVATWDDYYWADDAIPALFWQSCGGLGTYGSVRIKGQVNSLAVRWYGTDVVFEPGGML